MFPSSERLLAHEPRALAKAATAVENSDPALASFLRAHAGSGLILGITGPPGAGKSTLVDALAEHLRRAGKTVAIVAVDPSSHTTGGAILGDRIRMAQHHADRGIFIRSMATRGNSGGLARATENMARLFRSANFDFVVIETVGVGQEEVAVASVADVTAVVLVPGMGDDIQAIKAGVMEAADIYVVNKADYPGADQTIRDVQSMLSLTPGGKQTPILKTVATDGSGITELLKQFESFAPRKSRPSESFAIDHLGIAVKSLAAAEEFYQALGLPISSRETVTAERVHVAMLPAGESRIELLEATDPESAVAKFIAKRGEGLHHVALRVTDLHQSAERLRQAGARLLNEPRQGAGGHWYVFVHPQSAGGVLWELIQE